MNIKNLEVWIIDQFEYNDDSFILNDLTGAVRFETFDLVFNSDRNVIDFRSFNVNSVAEFEVFKNDTPFILFVDTDRNIALHKTRLSQENIPAIAKLALRIFSKYSYNETIDEYLNEYSIPVPRVLFRDPDTGILEIVQNTFSNLPGQFLSLIPKPVWGIKTIVCVVGAATVKNPITKVILIAGSIFSGSQFLKK